jgi:hypothetical protein
MSAHECGTGQNVLVAAPVVVRTVFALVLLTCTVRIMVMRFSHRQTETRIRIRILCLSRFLTYYAISWPWRHTFSRLNVTKQTSSGLVVRQRA